MSLRLRLNLKIALAMLLALGLGTWLVVMQARHAVEEEMHASVRLALRLTEFGVMAADGAAQSRLLAQLATLDRIRHVRLRFTEALDTPPVPSATPAQTQALSVPDWFFRAVEPQPLLVERRLRNAAGRIVNIAIQANPADEIAEAWIEARGFLTIIAGLAALVYALVHISLGRAFGAVAIISSGLRHMEQGDYERRLPEFALPEFACIARAFNHAAAALQRANAENRRLTGLILAIQEEERRHIAQELHDELGQSISAIKVMAASLRQAGEPKQTAESIMAICDHLFGVVRSMMRRLRPAALDELGLTAALEDLVAQWRHRCPQVNWALRCESGIDACAGAAKIHIFRIVQEAITNAVKHAQATEVAIELTSAKGHEGVSQTLQLEVRDNGVGLRSPAGTAESGYGLIGIRERIATLEGYWGLHSTPGRGLTLTARLPCQGVLS